MKKIYDYFTRISLFLILFSLLSPKTSIASNYYWVGGSGNWSDYATHWATTSGGLVFHNQEPTPFDNVFFDQYSFPTANDSIIGNSTLATCTDMDWTGVTNNPVFIGSSSTYSLELYGNLILNPGMTWRFGGNLNMKSTVPGKSIRSAGAQLYTVSFIGVGGGWTLLDALNAYTIDFANGVFHSANFQVSGSNISSNSGASAYFGSSVINTNYWNMYNINILDAANTTINISGQMARFEGGSAQYNIINLMSECEVNSWSGNSIIHKLTAYDNVSIDYPNTFDSLIFNNAGHHVYLGGSSTQTINNAFVLNGSCTGLISFQSSVPGYPALVSKTSGIVNISNAVMSDIQAIGGATFNASNSVILNNVSGWNVTAPAPRTVYWVGGTGNWYDASHWSLSSGGSGGACVPMPIDNVRFDANSFPTLNDTVYLYSTWNNPTHYYAKNLDCTGAGNNSGIYSGFYRSDLHVYGSLICSSGMGMKPGHLLMNSTSTGNTIRTSGAYIDELSLDGNGGSWILLDSLKTDDFLLVNGSFSSNNQLIRSYRDLTISPGFGSSFGISRMYCNHWDASQATIVYADSADFTILNYMFASFDGGIFDYHHVYFPNGGRLNLASFGQGSRFDRVISDADLFIYGDNIFDSLIFTSIGLNIYLGSGNTQTILSLFSVMGNCSSNSHIQSDYAGNQATIYKASGSVTVDYANLQDIYATGGATFIANNSVAVSNVTGWTVNTNAPRTLYWVAGTGYWTDPSHWSLSSGGAAGNCHPSQFDDVYFDVNSFSTPGDSVYIDGSSADCRNMNWTGAINYPTLWYVNIYSFNIYGSLTLIPAMNTYEFGFSFHSMLPGNNIYTGGQTLSSFSFDGGASSVWTLMDYAILTSGFQITNGTFYTNNFDVNASQYGMIMLDINSALYLGTSTITTTLWDASQGGFLDAAASTINIVGNMGPQMNIGSDHYHNVNFYEDCTIDNSMVFPQPPPSTFDHVVAYNNLTVMGTQIFGYLMANRNLDLYEGDTFDTLYLNDPGFTITLPAFSTQTINDLYHYLISISPN